MTAPTTQPQPRGYRRIEAARYVGVSPSKFLEWVDRDIMPKPIKVDGCTIWDRVALDAAFDSLAERNPFDEPEGSDAA